MSTFSPEQLLLIGIVVRPHGLDGQLRIRSYTESDKSLLDAGILFIELGSGETHEHTVLTLRPHKNLFLLKLDGVDSIEEAEKYKGASIFIRKDVLAAEEEGEFYWYRLIGLRVYLDSGKYVGTLQNILPTGGNDIYVVTEGDKEFLIPAIHDVITEIDIANKKMIITEMEGLLDLNEI